MNDEETGPDPRRAAVRIKQKTEKVRREVQVIKRAVSGWASESASSIKMDWKSLREGR